MAAREIRTLDAARRAYEYHIAGYDNFGDRPNLTVRPAERGFGEEEPRKVLRLNYLRYFREVVG
jgi:microsomal dipeptidase-like Zn-dependent dipeptidase